MVILFVMYSMICFPIALNIFTFAAEKDRSVTNVLKEILSSFYQNRSVFGKLLITMLLFAFSFVFLFMLMLYIIRCVGNTVEFVWNLGKKKISTVE